MKYTQLLSYFKQPKILKKTLHIWANQTFPKEDYEVIVLDGGNDPEGIAVAKECKKLYPKLNLRYFVYEGDVNWKCPVHAWNIGFKQAKGDIIGATMEDRLTSFDAIEALYRPHTREKDIFCTVLPYLTEGTLENNPIESVDWRSNPKLLWSIAKPTTIATKEKAENETIFYSLPRETILKLKGFDERWRDYGYWMLSLRKRFIDYGLKPHEVSWVPCVHHHHARHGTMEAHLYDGEARRAQWDMIKKANNNTPYANTGITWGEMEGDREIEL